MSWDTAIWLLGVCLTALRGMFFLLGAWRERRRCRGIAAEPGWNPFVSVVIPARNEERTIARCVHSVMACTYPNFEVIVVDDNSTDGTAAVLEQLRQLYGERLRVEALRDESHSPNLRGKARALHAGMEQAQGEIVLFTDADCRVPPSWIAGMVAPFREAEVGFVAGITLVEGTSFFARFQSVEWLLLSAAASGAAGWGQALGCFGTNLAVRAQAYWSVGGYARLPFSVTEDLTLQRAVVQAGWQQRYRIMPEVCVMTLPVATLGERLRQLQRWGRGGLHLGGWVVAFMATVLAFWAALGVALGAGHWLWAAGLLALRLGLEGALGYYAVSALRRSDMVGLIPVAVGWFALVELWLPVLVALRSRIRWKGRLLH